MGSISDWIADKEREEYEAKREALMKTSRAQIRKEMDEMDYDELFWFWSNRKKILAQKELIEMIGHW